MLGDTRNKRLVYAAMAGVIVFILFAWIVDWSIFWSLVLGILAGVGVYYVVGANEEAATGQSAAPKPMTTHTPVAAPETADTRTDTVTGGAAARTEPAPPASNEDRSPVGVAPSPGDAGDEGAMAQRGGVVAPAEKPTAPPRNAAGEDSFDGEAATPEARAAGAAFADDPATAASTAVQKPDLLDAPRGSGPDDLKRIKGVGPKLETTLNQMGIYHYEQIANWSPAEVAWVDQNLAGIKGRVSRDNWVSQARALSGGGGA